MVPRNSALLLNFSMTHWPVFLTSYRHIRFLLVPSNAWGEGRGGEGGTEGVYSVPCMAVVL